MCQQNRPMVRIVLRTQSEDESQRFGTATDFLLTDIVRRVLTREGEKSNETTESTKQTLHQSAPLQQRCTD